MVTALFAIILFTTNTTIGTYAQSEGQSLAQGQLGNTCNTYKSNHNPSGGYNPPGNTGQQDDMRFANPGQCQKYASDPSVFDVEHDFAHDLCFS